MFDVDGTLVLGDRSGGGTYDVLPGAAETLTALKARAIPYVLLTNGSAQPPAYVAAKLRAAGLPVEDAEMLTPSSVAADLIGESGARRVLVLGTPGVGEPLRVRSLQTFAPGEPGDVDAVYVGWHPDCTMADIEAAANAIWAGAQFYVASSVPFFATRAGKSIGYSRAIAAAIESLTESVPIITGKPSAHAMALVARTLGLPFDAIGVVGDDPKLETLMAREAGAVSFGVVTGIAKREDYLAMPPERSAHHVLDNVGELLSLI
jgi:4-nitrophenyl phosphatase